MTAYHAEALDAHRSLAHRHLASAHAALDKVSAAVNKIEPAGLTVVELVRLWEVAVRTEREALQHPVRLQVTGQDGRASHVENLTDEQRRSRMLALRRELDTRLDEANAALD